MRRPRRYLTAAAVGQTRRPLHALARCPGAMQDVSVQARRRLREYLIGRLTRGVGAADAEWEKAAVRTKAGDLLCREGCFGCCLGAFEISLPEALVLRAAVSRLGEGSQPRIRERAARVLARGAASFPGDPLIGVLDPGRSDEQDA